MRRIRIWAVALVLAVLPVGAQAGWTTLSGLADDLLQDSTLSNTCSYHWWYGCSPTSAGMLLGYYDRNGYAGQSYSNLIAGAAETSTYPDTPGVWQYNAQYAIASPGHVADFWQAGTGANGGGVTAATHSFDCLADFMGTDQGGKTGGNTRFHLKTDGSPYTYADAITYGVAGDDGTYGIGQYIKYRGYSFTSLYTEYTDNMHLAHGFTFQDYENEINAGRGVIIQVQGHSMAGIGYDNYGDIILYDTWTAGPHTMVWGGSYSGMSQWGVTVFELAGGSPTTIPAPGAALLAGLGASLVGWLRRKRTLA